MSTSTYVCVRDLQPGNIVSNIRNVYSPKMQMVTSVVKVDEHTTDRYTVTFSDAPPEEHPATAIFELFLLTQQ